LETVHGGSNMTAQPRDKNHIKVYDRYFEQSYCMILITDPTALSSQ